MSKPMVYIETTIVSYLAARPSRDLYALLRQQITADWWRDCRDRFELFISSAVIEEITAGDRAAAARRVAVCRDLPVLEPTDEVGELTAALLADGVFPPNAAADAAHVAFASVHAARYLVTWNFTHIANAALRKRIESVCRQGGFAMPTICTPEELMP